MKSHYVYKLNFRDGYYYIGKSYDPSNTNYLGSQAPIDGFDFKHRDENHPSFNKSDVIEKIVLDTFETSDEAFEYEAELVTASLISPPGYVSHNSAMYDPKCLNRNPGGKFSRYLAEPYQRKAMSARTRTRNLQKVASGTHNFCGRHVPWESATINDGSLKGWIHAEVVRDVYRQTGGAYATTYVLPEITIDTVRSIVSSYDLEPNRLEWVASLDHKPTLYVNNDELRYCSLRNQLVGTGRGRAFPWERSSSKVQPWSNYKSILDEHIDGKCYSQLRKEYGITAVFLEKLHYDINAPLYVEALDLYLSIRLRHSNYRKHRSYLCSPLFTSEDNATLDRVESILNQFDRFEYFSPRSGEVSVEFGACKDRAEKAKMAYLVYQENIDNLLIADFVLVNVDSTTFIDKNSRTSDTGTCWEMGYAAGLRATGRDVKIITYSSKGFGCNIMLACSSDCHLPTLDRLEEFMNRYMVGGESYAELCKSMSNIDGELY